MCQLQAVVIHMHLTLSFLVATQPFQMPEGVNGQCQVVRFWEK